MKILFVTIGLPFGTHGGAKMRNRGLIRSVIADHQVHLLSLIRRGEGMEQLGVNSQLCASVTAVEDHRQRREVIMTGLSGLPRRRPLAVAPFFLEAFAETLHRFLLQHEVDVIVMAESLLAPYMDAIPQNCRARVVIDFHNVSSDQYRTMTRLSGGRRDRLIHLVRSFLMRKWEARYARRADRCLVVSDEEARRLRKLAPGVAVSTVPNGIDTDALLTEASARNALLFTGILAYQPNADAMRFFCGSILPLVKSRVSDATLYIVGVQPPPDICALGEAQHPPATQAFGSAFANIIVTGEVADVRPYYETAKVVIVPLRAGGGTRLKILEAMALGRPVVTTALGCQGLDVRHGEHLMIADHPQDFANRVIELLENPRAAQRLCRNARRLVESRYDWNLVGAKFLKLCDQLGDTRARTLETIPQGAEA